MEPCGATVEPQATANGRGLVVLALTALSEDHAKAVQKAWIARKRRSTGTKPGIPTQGADCSLRQGARPLKDP